MPVEREEEITPQPEYAIPILEALIEMGGAGKVQTVLRSVYDKMKNRLKPKDMEKVKTGGSTMAKPYQMGAIQTCNGRASQKSSPRGLWEITEQGRKFYESSRSK